MKGISKSLVLFIVIFVLTIGCFQTLVVSAAENNDLVTTIEQTLDRDKKELSKLPALLEKAYNKLINAFKKVGTLGKDIKKVVSLYNSLDENSDDYPEKLEQFFEEYNKLGTVKRKVVDFCTGILDAKTKLIDSAKHIVRVDMYSTKTLETQLSGNIEFYSANETIAEVYDGIVFPKGIGTTKITAQNEYGEKESFRIYIKKPILSRTLRLSVGKNGMINVPADITINEIVVSSERIISYDQDGNNIEVAAITKGTAYIYVGDTTGKSLKYKIKVG